MSGHDDGFRGLDTVLRTTRPTEATTAVISPAEAGGGVVSTSSTTAIPGSVVDAGPLEAALETLGLSPVEITQRTAPGTALGNFAPGGFAASTTPTTAIRRSVVDAGPLEAALETTQRATPGTGPWANSPVLRVRDLIIGTRSRTLVGPVSFDVGAAERVGLIGESGSGKSLTALAIMGLLPDNLHATGQVLLAGQSVLGLPERAMAPLRGRVASMIFQEPMTALDPTMRVGKQIAEAYTLHGTPRTTADARAVTALAEVGLPDPAGAARAYPHQLSGGQRQRVLIAMALANDPALLIADEPTTALDVTVQQQVLALMTDLVAQRGAGLLFITHDLGVVNQVCQRLLVLKDGLIVESGPTAQVLARPQHPYTQQLRAASRLAPRAEAQSLVVSRASTDQGLDATDLVVSTGLNPGVSSAAFGGAPSTDQGLDTTDLGLAPAVDIAHVSKVYSRRRGIFASRGGEADVVALDDVSLQIERGECFGIVGESGSGKTTLLHIIAGLTTPTSGSVVVNGLPLTATTSPRDLAQLRSRLQVVFQDPMGSLDPRMSIDRVVGEPLLNPLNRAAVPEAATAAGREALVAQALADVGLDQDAMGRYPHEFSGGQRQRISIARALVTRPEIVLADEPVSALDVSVRGQVLDLLARIAAERGRAGPGCDGALPARVQRRAAAADFDCASIGDAPGDCARR